MNNLIKKHAKFLLIIPIMAMVLTLSGCWDKVEIDEKVFVSVIGINAGTDIDKINELKKIKPNEPFSDNNIKKLKVVYAFPDISQAEAGKGNEAEEKTLNIDAYSLQDAYSKASSKSSRDISFGHLKLLLLNASIFQYPDVVKEIFDYLERQPAIVRNIQVIVCDGDVENYIDYSHCMEKNIENYIVGLVRKTGNSGNIIPISLNNLIKNLNDDNNSIVPYMTIDRENKELNISKACVIKNFKFNNTMSNTEVADIKILRGNFNDGKKVIFKDGHPIDFQINNLQRKIKIISSKDGKLSCNINLSMEGEIKQHYFKENLLDKGVLEELEKDFNESLSEELERIIKVTQSKYTVDLIGIGDYLRKYHFRTWNKVKGDWDDVYKNIPITVNVNMNIRRIGSIK